MGRKVRNNLSKKKSLNRIAKRGRFQKKSKKKSRFNKNKRSLKRKSRKTQRGG